MKKISALEQDWQAINDFSSYFSHCIFENTGAGAEFGNFALAKLAKYTPRQCS